MLHKTRKKRIISWIILLSLIFGITFADDQTDVMNDINNMRNATRQPWILWDIFTKMFDTNGKIKEAFLYFTQTATEWFIPMWNNLNLIDSPIFSTWWLLWIWTTNLTEELTISGWLSIVSNPDSWDDVGNRDYNDIRYQEDIWAVNCANWIASINDLWIVTCAWTEASTVTTNYIPKSNWTSFITSSIYESWNNVWIWTVSPSNPLTVSWSIQSTNWWFKFPDSSIQLKAVLSLNDLNDATRDSSRVYIWAWAWTNDLLWNNNIWIWNYALEYNTWWSDNVAVWLNSLNANTTWINNVALWNYALEYNTWWRDNVAVWLSSLNANTTWINNVALWNNAWYNNSLWTWNVFLWYNAWYNETSSNKLYIDNSNTSSPLIYWDFSNDTLTFNGNVGIWTNNPLTNLHINTSTANDTTYVRIEWTWDQNSSWLALVNKDSSGEWQFTTRSGNNDNLYIAWYDGSTWNTAMSIAQTSWNVGIWTIYPQSLLQIDTPENSTTKYMQIDAESGAPTSTDCDASAEAGRMYFDSTNDLLYICSWASWWVSK